MVIDEKIDGNFRSKKQTPAAFAVKNYRPAYILS